MYINDKILKLSGLINVHNSKVFKKALVDVAEQVGDCFSWSKTPEDKGSQHVATLFYA